MPDFSDAVVAGQGGHIGYHDLEGTLFAMQYTQGTLAERPVAGVARRTFYATDTQQYFRDDGSAWHQVATADAATTWTANQRFTGTATFDSAATFNLPTMVTDKTSATNVALRGATGAVQYVTTAGNDANDGRSWGSAKSSIAGALAALGGRGRVFVGAGTFTFSSTIDLTDGVSIFGLGSGDHNTAATTKLNYTGSGFAFRMGTGVTQSSYAGLRDVQVSTGISTTGGLEISDSGGTNNGIFENIRFEGVAGGIAVYVHGKIGCACHHEFRHISIWGYATGINLSGFANANLFTETWIGNCTSWALDISSDGFDGKGGDDNVFLRLEIVGGAAHGIRNYGSRNLIEKATEDGGGATVALDQLGIDNTYINCAFGPGTFTDGGTNTVFINCTGVPTGYRNRFGAGGLVVSNTLNVLGTISVNSNVFIDGNRNAFLATIKDATGTLVASLFPNAFRLADATDIQLATGTGTKLGTAAAQKLGLWGATPRVQPGGWTAATGTATRTAFATSTVTTAQLAEHFKALVDDLLSVGAIGP